MSRKPGWLEVYVDVLPSPYTPIVVGLRPASTMIGVFLSNGTLIQGRQGRPVPTNACSCKISWPCKDFDRRSPIIAAKIKLFRRQTRPLCLAGARLQPLHRSSGVSAERRKPHSYGWALLPCKGHSSRCTDHQERQWRERNLLRTAVARFQPPFLQGLRTL